MPSSERTIRLSAQSWVVHLRQDCGRPDNPLIFSDAESAARWLNRFRFDQLAMQALRSLGGWDCPSILAACACEDDLVHSLAVQLACKRLHVHTVAWKPRPASTAPPDAQPDPVSRPSTLSSSSDSSSSSSPSPGPAVSGSGSGVSEQGAEPATFPPQTDGDATAAGLQNASDSGTPFCEECAKGAANKSDDDDSSSAGDDDSNSSAADDSNSSGDDDANSSGDDDSNSSGDDDSSSSGDGDSNSSGDDGSASSGDDDSASSDDNDSSGDDT